MVHIVLLVISLFMVSISGEAIKEEDGFRYLGTKRYMERNGQSIQSAYWISTYKASWSTALAQCRFSNRGELLAIESATENQEIKDLILGQGETGYIWTSGMHINGLWRWASTEQVISYFNWRPPYPIWDPEEKSRIAVGGIFENYGWHQLLIAADAYTFICEMK